jgi:predicted small integral membrane protein
MSSESKESPKLAEPKALAAVERLDRLESPPSSPPRKGFLPMDTNLFDRCFISVMCLIAVHLMWLRFIESILPIGFATGISLILAYAIIRWG